MPGGGWSRPPHMLRVKEKGFLLRQQGSHGGHVGCVKEGSAGIYRGVF